MVSKLAEILRTKIVGGGPSQLARFGDLFETSLDPIWILDPESLEILETNPAARSSQYDFLKNFWPLPLIHAIKNNSRTIIPLEIRDRHFDVSLCPLRLADYGIATQIILHDSTESWKAKNLDSKTQIPNHKFFVERLSTHLLASSPLSVAMMDLDHFKSFNDHNGHVLGDVVLQEVAALGSRIFQQDNFATQFARFGGEEFSAFLAGSDFSSHLDLCKIFLNAVNQIAIPGADKQPLGKMSLSMGIAHFSHYSAELNVDAVLSIADKALYAAKSAGRNQIQTFLDSK